jgi:ABC-type branched-subunit amino acid transport system permease subunit
MLTLAFAQIAWATAFQWVELTGGDNGISGRLALGLGDVEIRLLLPRARASALWRSWPCA